MIIRDVDYKITGIHYSVHYKNHPFRRIRIDCTSYSCFGKVVIEKTFWRGNVCIAKRYILKPFSLMICSKCKKDSKVIRVFRKKDKQLCTECYMKYCRIHNREMYKKLRD